MIEKHSMPRVLSVLFVAGVRVRETSGKHDDAGITGVGNSPEPSYPFF